VRKSDHEFLRMDQGKERKSSRRGPLDVPGGGFRGKKIERGTTKLRPSAILKCSSKKEGATENEKTSFVHPQ